jgi:hypothetical protein
MEWIEPDAEPGESDAVSEDEVVRLRDWWSAGTLMLLVVVAGVVGFGLVAEGPRPAAPDALPTLPAAPAGAMGERTVAPGHSEVDLYRDIKIVYLTKARDDCEADARG